MDKLFKVLYVTCADCQTVSVEGLMKGGKRDLDDEENVTDMKKRN